MAFVLQAFCGKLLRCQNKIFAAIAVGQFASLEIFFGSVNTPAILLDYFQTGPIKLKRNCRHYLTLLFMLDWSYFSYKIAKVTKCLLAFYQTLLYRR
jgi:hypothetical protein